MTDDDLQLNLEIASYLLDDRLDYQLDCNQLARRKGRRLVY